MTVKTHLVRIALAITAFAAAMSVALAAPQASMATDGTSTSSYYCAYSYTPWLCKSSLAGYRCFQYSNCTGKYSSASRR